VFTVATEPAELVLTTATQALNGQVFKAPFTVEGYGSDPVDINRVTIKVDGAPEVKHMPKTTTPNMGTYDASGMTYNFSWNNSAAYSGTDENGNGTANATLPYFGTKFTTTANAANTTAPAAQLFTYASHGLTNGEIVYVGGEPRYVNAVSTTTFKLFRTYSGGTFSNADPASGTAGNITVSTGLEEGPHVITITARSSSGISGANSTKQIAFTKDTEPPIVNFGNIDETKTLTKAQWQAASSTFTLAALNNLLNTLKPKQIGSDAAIQGSFYDVNNELETNFQYRIYNSTTLRNTWTDTAYASPSAPGTPQWTLVTLPAGKKSANWTIPLNTASIYWPATGGGTAPTSIPDGTWWLDIRVLDKTGNEAYFRNIVFTVDKSDPTISITSTGEPTLANNVQPASPFVYGNYTGDIFTLKGTANDVNLRKVEVKLSRNTDRYMATTDTVPDAAEADGSTTKSWQRIFSSASFSELITGGSVGYTALENGQYTITATAYDDSRTASDTYTFIKDTAVPGVKFLTNAVNFDNPAVSIQGSAIDTDSGVFEIWTYIEEQKDLNGAWTSVSDDTYPTGKGITAAAQAKKTVSVGGQNRTFTLLDRAVTSITVGGNATIVPNLEGLGTTVTWTKEIVPRSDVTSPASYLRLDEGRYRIYVHVVDRATPANVFTSAEKYFSIDTDRPYIYPDATPTFVNGSNHLSTHPFYHKNSQGVSDASYPKGPATPAVANDYPAVSTLKGFYITGTAVSKNAGMLRVTATLSLDGKDLITVRYPPTDPATPFPAPDTTNPWKWGVLIPETWQAGNATWVQNNPPTWAAGKLEHGKTYTVNITAYSGTDRVNNKTRDFNYDTEVPTATIILPIWKDQVTGMFTVRGGSGDDNAVSMVESWIGRTGTWADTGLNTNSPADAFTGGLYSWTYELNSTNNGKFVNATDAYAVDVSATGEITRNPQSNSNIWELPFRIRVTDSAGNQGVNTVNPANGNFQLGGSDYFILLDPDADMPKATITYPNNGDLLGGQIRITGSATDNTWIYAILVRVARVNTNGVREAFYGSSAYGAYKPGEPAYTVNTDGWGLATIVGSPGQSVVWSYNINRNREFEPAATSGTTQQDMYIEVKAVDSKAYNDTFSGTTPPTVAQMNAWQPELDHKTMLNPATCAFVIDTSLPSIATSKIQKQLTATPAPGTYEAGDDYVDQIKTSGTFRISTTVSGSAGISRVQWRSTNLTAGSYITMMDLTATTPIAAKSVNLGVEDAKYGYTLGMPVTDTGASSAITGGTPVKGRKYIISKVGSGISNWGAIGYGAGGALTAQTATQWTTFVATGTAPQNGSGWEFYAAQGAVVGDATINAASYTKAQNQRFYYPLTIIVASTELFPTTGTSSKASSGGIPVDIQAEDFSSPSPYRVQQNMNIRADNYYPSGVYSTPKNVSTKNQYVSGTATDFDDSKFSGPVYGLNPEASGKKAQVLVYFERGGSYYNPYGQVWTTGNSNAALNHNTTKTVKEGTPGNTGYGTLTPLTSYPDMLKSFTLPQGVTGVTLRPAAAINETSTQDLDADGYIEEFSSAGTGTYAWSFRFDTTRFGDGPIKLHYIVVDEAGNATHYSEDMYIRNKPPIISKVTLMTDLIFSHDVTSKTQPQDKDPDTTPPTGASHTYNVADKNHKIQDTEFTGKNYRLSFKVETTGGNTNNRFRVSSVTRGTAITAAGTGTAGMTVGAVYSIATGGTLDWELAGAPAGTNQLASQVGVAFVCTSKVASGTGTVYPYTVRGTREETGAGVPDGAGDANATMNFGNRWSSPTTQDTDKDFVYGTTTADRIPDATGNLSFFMIKVYDTTVSGGAEADQQSDLIIMGLNLQNLDTAAPTTKIEPFFYTNVQDNSTYDSGAKDSDGEFIRTRIEHLNGHIELEKEVTGTSAAKYTAAGYTANLPKVSGQVSVWGTVSDKNVIRSLWVNMSTSTTAGLLFGGAPASETLNNLPYQRIAYYDPTATTIGSSANAANATAPSARQLTYNNHGLTTGDIVTVGTTAGAVRYVYRIDANNIKLFEDAKFTTPNPASGTAGNVTIVFYKLKGVDQWTANGWRCEILSSDITQSGNEVRYRLDFDTNRHTAVVALNQGLKIRARDVYDNTEAASGTQTAGTGGSSNLYNMDIVPYIHSIKTTLSKAYNAEPSAFNRSATGGYPVRNGDTITVRGFNILTNAGALPGSGGITATLGGLLGAAQTLNGASTASTSYTFALPAVDPEDEPDDPEVIRWSGKSASTTIKSSGANDRYDSGANSGYLELKVSGIYAINNHNDTTASYNKEPNRTNNDLLVNDRYLYIWNTGSILPYNNTAAGNTGSVIEDVNSIYQPFMRITNTGVRYLSYGRYSAQSTGRIRVGKNNATYDLGSGFSNRIMNSTVGIGTAGTFYAMGSDQTSTSNRNRGFSLGMSNNSGTATYPNTGSEPTLNPTQIGLVPNLGNSLSTRFRIPRVAVRSTGGTRTNSAVDQLFISYYDDEAKTLNAVYGVVGETRAVHFASGRLQEESQPAYNTSATIVAVDKATTAIPGAGSVTGKRGSIYSAAGLLNNGRPVLAWYDETNRKLYLSWAGTPTSTTVTERTFTTTGNAANTNGSAGESARTFTYNSHGLTTGEVVTVGTNNYYVLVLDANTFKLFTNNSLYTAAYASGTNTGNITITATSAAGSYVTPTQQDWQNAAVQIDTNRGAHVDMAVDGGNNIHLAYYDVSNGGLWYALVPNNNGTPNPTGVKPVRVDTFLSVGTRIMINVREEGTGKYVPYITYAHNSFPGTKHSVRVAWRKDFTTPAVPPAGMDASNKFLRTWEVMTVPAGANPKLDEFICNGVPTSNTIGTTGWEDPPQNTGANPPIYRLERDSQYLQNSIVVGYMTEYWYEGAILKGNIR
jgi:hypothetical protein